MSRLRAITESGRLDFLIQQVEQGGEIDFQKLATLQALDLVKAGRAALLDALDREDQADGELKRQLELHQ